MKKIFLPLLILFIGLFFSCEKDESLNPRPIFVNGQFMRLDIQRDRLDLNDPNTSFGGKLTNPSGDVVRYELFVRLSRADNVQNDYIPYEVLTVFPTDFSITPAKISQAFVDANLNIGPLKKGDFFRFIAYSYDANGKRAGYSNLSRTVQSIASYKQAYRFNLNYTDDLIQPVNNYLP